MGPLIRHLLLSLLWGWPSLEATPPPSSFPLLYQPQDTAQHSLLEASSLERQFPQALPFYLVLQTQKACLHIHRVFNKVSSFLLAGGKWPQKPNEDR